VKQAENDREQRIEAARERLRAALRSLALAEAVAAELPPKADRNRARKESK